jgi:hypothetical protein
MMADTVPCAMPVSTTGMPAARRHSSTWAGLAFVVMSQSCGSLPESASRTQPPTT